MVNERRALVKYIHITQRKQTWEEQMLQKPFVTLINKVKRQTDLR